MRTKQERQQQKSLYITGGLLYGRGFTVIQFSFKRDLNELHEWNNVKLRSNLNVFIAHIVTYTNVVWNWGHILYKKVFTPLVVMM